MPATQPETSAEDMTVDAVRAHNQRVACWVYNDKHREERNKKKRVAMANRRASETSLPPEEREARRHARLAAGFKYREKNREVLALAEKERRRLKKVMPGYRERYDLIVCILDINIYYPSSLERQKAKRQSKKAGASNVQSAMDVPGTPAIGLAPSPESLAMVSEDTSTRLVDYESSADES
ncbi:hypothetical protein C8R44DRAFT_880827 [Mycena epipterygia]|nr:hypothetical protein C8R44DRAFT_880827 [Mycena epipterygia]